MTRLKISQAVINEWGEEFVITTEDGKQQTFAPVVHVTVEDGREFILPNGEVRTSEDEGGSVEYVYKKYSPTNMLEQVQQEGSIDPSFWMVKQSRTYAEQREIAERKDRDNYQFGRESVY